MGLRLKEGMEANIEILSGNAVDTLEDRVLLAEYSAIWYDSASIKKMRTE